MTEINIQIFQTTNPETILVESVPTIKSTVSMGVNLGETPNTAYRGDRGKIAYDHTLSNANPHGVTKTQVGLGNVLDKEQLGASEKAVDSTLLDGNTLGQVRAGTTKSDVGLSNVDNVQQAPLTHIDDLLPHNKFNFVDNVVSDENDNILEINTTLGGVLRKKQAFAYTIDGLIDVVNTKEYASNGVTVVSEYNDTIVYNGNNFTSTRVLV